MDDYGWQRGVMRMLKRSQCESHGSVHKTHIGCKLSVWVAVQVSPKEVQLKRGGAMVAPSGQEIELLGLKSQ